MPFGISDEPAAPFLGRDAGDGAKLYSLCHRRAALVPLPVSVGFFEGATLLALIDAKELTPVLSATQKALEVGLEQTKRDFLIVFLFAHGYVSIIANNSLRYDEETIKAKLEQTYRGVLAAQEESR